MVIEVSIKGTNPKEFKLIADPQEWIKNSLQGSDAMYEELFKYNIQAYYNLRKLELPNLRPTVIAGYGISESYLLTKGRSPNSRMTILFDKNTPTYHPSLWSSEFKKLYENFINDCALFKKDISILCKDSSFSLHFLKNIGAKVSRIIFLVCSPSIRENQSLKVVPVISQFVLFGFIFGFI